METDTRALRGGGHQRSHDFCLREAKCVLERQDKAAERRAGYLQAEDTPCRRREGKMTGSRKRGNLVKRVDC